MNRIIRIFLSLVIAISPVLLINNANAAIGGWTLSNPVAQGASAVYDASKTVLINGKNVVKTSVVTITPTATEVAKVLARGGATLALTVAVEQLLGAVDWVLDPANSQILYTESDALLPPNACSLPYLLQYGSEQLTTSQVVQRVKSNVNKRVAGSFAIDYVSAKSITCTSNQVTIQHETKWCTSNCAPGSVYTYGGIPSQQTSTLSIVGTAPQEDKKSLPLSTVASQVISNAESESDAQKKASAQAATMAAAADIVQEAETDETKARPIATELDKAASTPTSETATGESTATNPTTGEAETTDLSLEFPTFCGWAPLVCEAAQVVISVPQAVAEAWAMTKEWLFADDALPDAETPDISELPIPELEENAVSWSAQCPNDVDIPINLQGVSSTITFSWSPWCQLLSMIKPAIIASAYIGAAFIVLGLRT